MRLEDQQKLSLVVETSEGLYLRSVREASPLPEGEVGPAAEDATRRAAMQWGLPDFVFRSAVRSRGNGVRELGDVIVCVGDVGAVVQVKARAEVSDDAAREAGWLAKKVPQAIRQAQGTLRTLARKERELLVNERGNRVEVDYAARTWVPVVVIDHPAARDFRPEAGAVVLWRRDWEFLFDQLKSTSAVLHYLLRIKDDDPVPLGGEPVRYYELAAADVAAPPGWLDLTGLGGQPIPVSLPILPQAPAGQQGPAYHMLQRILEDIALSPRPADVEEAEFLDVLAAIDTMAVAARAELGEILLKRLDVAAQITPDQFRWDTRRYLGVATPHLLFTVAPHFSKEIQEGFGWLVRLRHLQLTEARPDLKDILTVGVLLTPRRVGPRLWDTSLCATSGPWEISHEDRALLEQAWPVVGEGPLELTV